MGYDIHIHRRLRWFDIGSDITTEEWDKLINGDPELEHTEKVEVPFKGGIFSYKLKDTLLAKWMNPPSNEVFWFDLRKGKISTKYNKDEILIKAIEIAKKLKAKVQGDEGETYYLPRNNSPIRLDYRKLRKANLPIDFPMIDDINIEAKTVTRMEILDLTTDENQDLSRVDTLVREYINELSKFYQVNWKDYWYKIDRDFQDRYLELGIPAGKATRAQTEKLLELHDYAQTKGVTLVINEVP